MKRLFYCILYCLSFSIIALAQSKDEDLSFSESEELSITDEISVLERKISSLEQKINLYDNRTQFQKESQKERHNELEKRLELARQDLSSKNNWTTFITAFLAVFIIFVGASIFAVGYFIGKKLYKEIEEQKDETSRYLNEINNHLKSIGNRAAEDKTILERLSTLSTGNLTDEVFDSGVLSEVREITMNPDASSFEKDWAKALTSYCQNDYFDTLSKLNALLEDYSSEINLKILVYIYSNMISCYYHKEKYNIALMYCDSIISLDPVNETVYCNKGIILSKLTERQEEALRNFEKAIEINPYDSQSWTSKGSVLLDLEKHTEALECFDTALKIDPADYVAWSNKGIILSRYMEEHEKAIIFFDRSIKINENYLFAWVHKGHVLTVLGRHTEAIACFDKILEKDPTNEIVKECRKDLLQIIE